MDDDALLNFCRTAIGEIAPEVVELIRSVPDSTLRIPNSDWTAREAAVHLVICHNFYGEFATGTASPVTFSSTDELAEISAQLLADIPETDPGKLAALLAESVERHVATLAGRSGDQPIAWHNGWPLTLAQQTAILLGELVLHGYDLAGALGRAWPIDPMHAAAILTGYLPLPPRLVNPATAAGHSARYELRLGNAAVVFAFADGVLTVGLPGAAPVDCVIDADPVAYLLVSSGRAPVWPAFASGQFRAGGARPELAPGFSSLFVSP